MIGINQIVRTSYGTGPYRITSFSGPITEPEYLRHIDGDDSPSEEHYNITCAALDGRGGEYYLNGYRPDGTNVWTDDRLLFEGICPGKTGDMFVAT